MPSPFRSLIAAVLLQACGDSGSSADGGMTCAAPDVAVLEPCAAVA